MKRLLLAGLLALSVAGPVRAVQPDEMLADPALEARAREISRGLRCLVCRNEAIDESNASLARDLRLLVRERILAGDDDAQVVDFVVDRYGEYVLLQPLATGSSLFLWVAGPTMLLISAGLSLAYLRSRSIRDDPVLALSDAEKERLAHLTEPDG